MPKSNAPGLSRRSVLKGMLVTAAGAGVATRVSAGRRRTRIVRAGRGDPCDVARTPRSGRHIAVARRAVLGRELRRANRPRGRPRSGWSWRRVTCSVRARTSGGSAAARSTRRGSPVRTARRVADRCAEVRVELLDPATGIEFAVVARALRRGRRGSVRTHRRRHGRTRGGGDGVRPTGRIARVQRPGRGPVPAGRAGSDSAERQHRAHRHRPAERPAADRSASRRGARVHLRVSAVGVSADDAGGRPR